MKLHFYCLFLIFSATVQATTVLEIKDLKESGFSEEQILELVIKEKNYEVSDLIELKKLGFSPNFIVNLRNKDLANDVDLAQSNTNEEISPLKEQIESSEKKLSDLEKCLSSITRTLGILATKNYESTGLWSDLGKLYKRNGYDQSLQAPARDSERFQRLLNESISGLSDDIGISQNDFFSLIDTWVELKKSAMEVDAISEAARSDAYKRSDNRPSSNISSQLLSEKSSLKRYEESFLSKRASIIQKIKSAITSEEQKVEELKILNTNGPYEEKVDGITYKGTWKASKNHGKRTSFYDSGVKEGQENWSNGIKVGKEERWFENGNLKAQISWSEHGIKNGEEFLYYPSGELRSSFIWDEGSILEQKEISKDGDIIFHSAFKNGFPHSAKRKVNGEHNMNLLSFDQESKLVTISLFQKDSTKPINYNFFTSQKNLTAPNLNQRVQFNLKNTQSPAFILPHGPFEVSSDHLKYSGKYQQGIPIGIHSFSKGSDTNITLTFPDTVTNDELEALVTAGIDQLKIEGRIAFANIAMFTGKLESSQSRETFYLENNKLEKVLIGSDANPKKIIFRTKPPSGYTVEDYYNNGVLKGEITIADGDFHGTSSLYRPNGTKIIEVNYANGIRNGTTSLFHDNGELSCEINYVNGRINDKISAFYKDGEKYNPKSGFLSTKYSLKYSKDSVWRSGIFKSGAPSGKQIEYNQKGEDLHFFENIESISEKNEYYGIFEVRIDPHDTKTQSLSDYDAFKKSDFEEIHPSFRGNFKKLDLILSSFSSIKTLEPEMISLGLNVHSTEGLINENLSFSSTNFNKSLESGTQISHNGGSDYNRIPKSLEIVSSGEKNSPQEIMTFFLKNRVTLEFNFVNSGNYKNYFSIDIPLLIDGNFVYALIHAGDGPFRVESNFGKLSSVKAQISGTNISLPIRINELAMLDDPRILIIPIYARSTDKLISSSDVSLFRAAENPFLFDGAVILDPQSGKSANIQCSSDDKDGRYFRLDSVEGSLVPDRGEYVFSKHAELLGIMVNQKYAFHIKNIGGRIQGGSRTLIGNSFDPIKTNELLTQSLRKVRALNQKFR